MHDAGGRYNRFDGNEGLARYRRFSLWVTRSRAEEISSRIKDLSGVIVEIGSGPGYLISELNKRLPKDFRVYGLDIDEGMLRFASGNIAADRRKTLFVHNEESSLPFKDDSVSMVVSEYSMHHWAYPEKMLSEIYRVLAPGGEAVIFDFYRETIWYQAVTRIMAPIFLLKKPPYRNQLMKFVYAYYSSLRQAYSSKDLSAMLDNISVKTYQMLAKRMTLRLKISKLKAAKTGQP